MKGVTLIELMVAVAISGFLMIGAVTVFMQARTSFRINESISRLQENARFVLDTLEPDIRMQHFWGLSTRTYAVLGRLPGTAAHAGMGPDTCGNNWVIDLENVVGTNGGYDWDCDPFSEEVAGADTLIVRRAAQEAVDPAAAGFTAATVFIQSGRGGTPAAQLFTGTAIPADFNSDTSDTFRLVANGYYVDETSSVANMPSLRRKTLAATGVINDEEVLPGVEDLQVEYGIDTNPVGSPNRGSITRYVTADDALLAAADTEVLAVRIWLRIRAESPENGFTDTATYVYSDRDEGPFNDAFRRVVVSKTIYLRNARPAS
jgi:type IV pilus assembly protein PilW